ncbi:MAG: lysophospholipid acyltransferase family protein [Chthoniobacterales bacterium]
MSAKSEKTTLSPLKRARYFIEYAGLKLGVWIVGLLSYSALRPLANFLGSLVWFLDTRGRRVAIDNLRCAFPGRFNDAELKHTSRASYKTFARTMLELLWAPRLTKSIVEKHIRYIGTENIPAAGTKENPGTPVVFFCMHAASFEWLSLSSTLSKDFPARPGLVLTQKLRNPRLGPIFDKLRASSGHEIIPQERAVLRMLRWLRSGGSFYMLNDLNIDPREGGVVIEAFGMKMCVTPIHVAMAQKTGAVLLPSAATPRPDGGYDFKIYPGIHCPPEKSQQELTQQCWDVLENYVRENPALWLWSYKHWRYRPKDAPPESYPFYANTAARFDKLL